MTTATKVQTWDFSWARAERTFRLIADGETIYADRKAGFRGQVFIESADGSTGHMRISAAIDRLNSGEIIFYMPEGWEFPQPPESDETVFAEWNQLCFNRKGDNWRTWDKADRAKTLEFVSGYRGPAYVDWHDGGGHFYVHGRRAIIDGIATFYGDKP